jgi:hypothetical protein
MRRRRRSTGTSTDVDALDIVMAAPPETVILPVFASAT